MSRELPFEREAMRGDPMPAGLDFPDQYMYQGLAWLYARYHAGFITKEQGQEEKGRLLYRYDVVKRAAVWEAKMMSWHAKLMKNIEAAAAAFRKDRTAENGTRLLEAVYNTIEERKDDDEKEAC